MATTYTDFVDNQTAGKPMDSGNKEFWIENELDLSDYTLVADDVFNALKLNAGWRVMRTNVRIVTAAVASALTFDIGLATGTEFDAAIDVTAAAGTEYESAIGTDSGVAGGAGTLFASADTIDVSCATVTSVTSNPVIKVRALIRDIN